MNHDHLTHTGGAGLETVLPLAVLVTLALGYVFLAHRQRQHGREWSRWRTASFLAGTGLLAAAVVPVANPLPPGSFAAHMYQHLLIGMYAPLGLVLAAPITLVLRSVHQRHGRRIGRVLASPQVGVLAHPVTALILNIGGLYLLYVTPLYTLTAEYPALHHLVHVHFLLAGYLFAYAIAGVDPAPHRPSVPARLVILGVAIIGHAGLAQLLYAGAFVHVAVPAADRQAGAELMYYAGDIAELLLAFAMISTWRPNRKLRTRQRPITTPI